MKGSNETQASRHLNQINKPLCFGKLLEPSKVGNARMIHEFEFPFKLLEENWGVRLADNAEPGLGATSVLVEGSEAFARGCELHRRTHPWEPGAGIPGTHSARAAAD